MALIDRDAAIKTINDNVSTIAEKTFYDCLLYRIPAVDAKPVVHGEWIWDDKLGRWYCSKCDNSPDYGFDFDNPGWMPDMNYCPNCGAEMRGDTDG